MSNPFTGIVAATRTSSRPGWSATDQIITTTIEISTENATSIKAGDRITIQSATPARPQDTTDDPDVRNSFEYRIKQLERLAISRVAEGSEGALDELNAIEQMRDRLRR